MENEYAAHQARSGDGVTSHSIPISQIFMRDKKTLHPGKSVSLPDAFRVLKEAEKTLSNSNPHPKDKSAIVVGRKEFEKLIVSLVRVPGRQLEVESGESLEQQVKREASILLAATKEADKIATAIREDEDFSAEALEEMLEKSPARELTLSALRSIHPKAAQVFGAAGPLPRLNGTKLPNSYRSVKPHRVVVNVQGGVNTMSGVVCVAISEVKDSNAMLAKRIGSRKVFNIKCPLPKDQMYFVAAQCAGAAVEVVLSANVPLYHDRRRAEIDLHLIEIVGRLSLTDLLSRAMQQFELDL